RTAAAALIALASLLSPGAARADVLPVTTPIAGQPQLFYADQWWPWAIPFPVDINPVLDPTGAQGFRGDVRPVFYLAGTVTGDPVTRTVTVPAGTVLFFPILNSFSDNTPLIGDEPTNFTAQELLDLTTGLEPGEVTLFASIDGVPIPFSELVTH